MPPARRGMTRHTTLDQLSPTKKRVLGAGLVALGVGEAALMYFHPETLRVPAWVGYAACVGFALTGAAVALHASLSRRTYGWLITVLLVTMTSIPVWIAFGEGDRSCTSNLPLLTGATGCRVVFGFSAVVMVGVVLIAIAHTRRLPPE
jgi:hypothetical protein